MFLYRKSSQTSLWVFKHLCSLLPERTSVLVSIALVRLWGCLNCQECASLTGVVTSMKILACPWLSPSPMNLGTGKDFKQQRSTCRVHVSVALKGMESNLNWVSQDLLSMWHRFTPWPLHLIWEVGVMPYVMTCIYSVLNIYSNYRLEPVRLS